MRNNINSTTILQLNSLCKQWVKFFFFGGGGYWLETWREGRAAPLSPPPPLPPRFLRLWVMCSLVLSLHYDSYELIGLCWTESPDKRPSFQELVERVNSLLEGVAGYLDFSAFSGECQGVMDPEDSDKSVETQSDAEEESDSQNESNFT